jgi:hypothetical protein
VRAAPPHDPGAASLPPDRRRGGDGGQQQRLCGPSGASALAAGRRS